MPSQGREIAVTKKEVFQSLLKVGQKMGGKGEDGCSF